MMRPDSIRLKNLSDEYRLSFPLPRRHRISQARLVLDFTHSNVLVPSRSQLRVRVNGVTVGQWRLRPEQARRRVSLDIPPELLLEGYNELQFLSALHYTDKQCEAAASPELWAEIDPLRSRLEFRYDLRDAPLSLAGLSSLFDKKLPPQTVALLLPAAEPDEEDLNLGGLAVQGIALRYDYAPFGLELGRLVAASAEGPLRFAVPAARDVVVIAERGKLAAFVSPAVAERIGGPYLGLFPAPGNPGRFVLILSGNDAAEVREAVRAFAWMNFPLPDAPETVIRSVRLRPPQPYQGFPALEPGGAYSLKELGFQTASRHGISPDPMAFELFLPPDLFAPEHAEVVFRFHLAYDAGMRRDSLLEMRINGTFERAIQLPEEGGAQYRDYRVAVPLRSFRPGINRISLQPKLVPLVTGECLYIQTDNLQVTLFDDSRVEMPQAEHYAQLPDLSLLAGSGFPYLAGGDGASLGIRLLNPRTDTVLAVWQLLAKMARLNRLPLEGARLRFTPFDDDRDLLVVGGGVTSLKDGIFHGTPLEADPWHVWRYPAGRRLDPPQAPGWRAWFGRFLAADAGNEARLRDRYVAVAQSGGLGRQALGFSFRHPERPARLVTAFVAEGDLYPAIRALTSPALWSQMKGDLIVWREGSRTLSWQRIGEPFQIGDAGVKTALLFHFSRHPWYWLLAVFAVLCLFAALTHFLLDRFKRRHHPDAEEIAP